VLEVGPCKPASRPSAAGARAHFCESILAFLLRSLAMTDSPFLPPPPVPVLVLILLFYPIVRHSESSDPHPKEPTASCFQLFVPLRSFLLRAGTGHANFPPRENVPQRVLVPVVTSWAFFHYFFIAHSTIRCVRYLSMPRSSSIIRSAPVT
jgi:hypothetical protein